MRSLSSLSEASQEFIKSLNSNKLLCTQIGLAKAIANSLVIPTSEVEDKKSFYQQNCFTGARSVVSEINELVVVDASYVAGLVAMFWEIRYSTVYPTKRIFVGTNGLSEADFFGYGIIVPPDILAHIRKDTMDVIKMTNGFTIVLRDIKGTTDGTQ